jgi:DNA-binding NarL/FixJ family response regulator
MVFRVLAKTSVPSSASQLHYAVKCCRQHSPHAVTAMVKSVLIADDNAFVRRRLGELFNREPDFEVCAVAENGRKAIEEAEESHPDLILLDLSMPVMNGLDAARALKRLMPKVPIMMFSVYSDSFTEKEVRSAGVSALVSKFEDSSTDQPTCENGS